MKLMTLKDIIVKIPITIPAEDYERAAQRLENECNFALKLKQEAIKWIKHIEKYSVKDCLSSKGAVYQMNWIKNFFNITEEELK